MIGCRGGFEPHPKTVGAGLKTRPYKPLHLDRSRIVIMKGVLP
jgi:hypothetical protein